LLPEREDDLLSELKWLRHNQADLDARLQRVEASLIFRLLRKIGTFYQTNFQIHGSGSIEEYRGWTRQHLGTGPKYNPAWTYQPLICIRIEGEVPASLRAQTYGRWTLDITEADYVAELPANIVLEPDVLARAVAAMQQNQPGTIYFDHQLIDDSGDPLEPVFKPDWSPALAESCNYMGEFVLRSKEQREGTLHIPEIGYSTRSRVQFHENPPVPKSHPLVSVLICTRNAELLARCLSSLRANTNYPAIETIIIHHVGSEHDARIAELVRESNAHRVPYNGAFNFSAMNNLGAQSAKGEILLFLNDDVEPLDPRWLERMVAQLERASTGAVGAKLLYYNGSIQHAGLVTWEMGGAGHPGRFLTTSEYWPWLNATREVTAVTGACLAIRRSDFTAIGSFDPIFPNNYNDVDLCLRLKDRGLSTILEATAILQHDEGQTRSTGVSFEERRKFFLRWHHCLEQTDPYYNPHLSQNDESLSLRP
jgi:GT2 family glycosyltransferase